MNVTADTITFAAGVTAITLTHCELSVGSDVTIDGGTGVTIDANELSRVLRILDFNRGQGDKIDLRTIDANEGAPGNQPFQFVGTAAVSGLAQLHVEAFDGDFLVTGNVDADPAADFAIVARTGLASLRAADFLL